MNITYNGEPIRRATSIGVGETAYAGVTAYTPETDTLHYIAIGRLSPTIFRDAGEPYLRIKRTGADDWDIKRFDPPYPTQAEELHYKVARVKLVKDSLYLSLKEAKDLVDKSFEDDGHGPREQSAEIGRAHV